MFFFPSGLQDDWHQGVKYDFIIFSWKGNGKTLKNISIGYYLKDREYSKNSEK